MPRIARAVEPGLPHHITQRGNSRQQVFFTDYDRRQYLAWLKEDVFLYGVRLWAWCLMPNHVHFVAVPEHEEAFARAFNHLHARYAQRVNSRLESPGHLWQARFYSCVLDDQHLFRAVRYVENNPVRARLSRHAGDYPWSSARTHLGGANDGLTVVEAPLSGMIDDWDAYLREGEQEAPEWVKEFHRCTGSGRPFGSEEFVADLEARLRRSLRAPGRGRPRKNTEMEGQLELSWE